MKHYLAIVLWSILASTQFSIAGGGDFRLKPKIGIGLPELPNAGIHFDFNRFSISTSIGCNFSDLFTLSTALDYHFGLNSMSSSFTKRLWFSQLGITYMESESPSAIIQDAYCNFRIGRDIPITKKICLSFSGGLGFLVYHYKVDLDPGGWNFDITFPVIPSAQASLHYTLIRN